MTDEGMKRMRSREELIKMGEEVVQFVLPLNLRVVEWQFVLESMLLSRYFDLDASPEQVKEYLAIVLQKYENMLEDQSALALRDEWQQARMGRVIRLLGEKKNRLGEDLKQ